MLQEREFERVGGTDTIKVDVRVIAATNRDLLHEIAKGRFREDLYYRLNVVSLEMPSLRERRSDIPALVTFFIERYAKANEKAIEGCDPAALELLMNHGWPGDVRELENAIERAAVLATGQRIEVEDLPDDVRAVAATESGNPCSLGEVERKHILAVLQASDGNRTKAAATLGIGAATLYRKLKEYGADPRTATRGT